MVESQSTQRPAWQCVHTVAAAQTEQKTMSRRIAHPSNPAKRARPAAFSVAACSRADHMETSDQAIRDVAHVLRVVASCCLPSGSPQSSLRLWDPYYCQGTVKVHFKKQGFPHCHNRREDFYAVWKTGALPAHDVLVTNPPYSGNHIQRALQFCAEEIDKPWAMLLPTTVLSRSWWNHMALRLQRGGDVAPVAFVAPATNRYTFEKRRPSGGGCKSGSTSTAPEVETVWFIGGLEPDWAAALSAYFSVSVDREEIVLVSTPQQLPRR